MSQPQPNPAPVRPPRRPEGQPRAEGASRAGGVAQRQAAKRGRILEAAHEVFTKLGFAGASMSDIAAEAGVSKPTLYVYFTNKESLFRALIEEQREALPELSLDLDADCADLRGVLTRYGVNLLTRVLVPGNIALLRLAFASAETFPAVARMLYESGPAQAVDKLKAYLGEEVGRGRIAADDVDLAAYHLLDLIQSRHLRRALFGVGERPTREAIEAGVARGVDVFLRAYGTAEAR